MFLRTKFKEEGFSGILLFSIFLLCTACNNVPVTQRARPNIILIVADDLGYGDLSCYGQQKFSTPNIDKLAVNGIRFTQFYAGASICAPSRSTLITGQHTGHTPIRGNKAVQPEGQFPLPENTPSLARLLKEGGYVTGAFGKWGLGFPGSSGDPLYQGFDTFYGYNCQRLAHSYYPDYLRNNTTKEYFPENETYSPEIIHQKALNFIRSQKDTTFFLYYPTTIPHAELSVPEKYLDLYKNHFVPEKAFNNQLDTLFGSQGYTNQQYPKAAYAAMIHLLDIQVGEILSLLSELDIDSNTIVIFTSDNGPHREGGADPEFFNSSGNLRGFKRDLYEGGIRVPFIASWPDKIRHGTSEGAFAFWDILPTLCDISQVKTPESIDGISFQNILFNKENIQKHHHLYWEDPGQHLQAVRMGDWKGIQLWSNDGTSSFELYNLHTDPEEQRDVAQQNHKIVVKIKEIMNSQHRESDDFPFYQQ